ncbi:MAG: hypothetical protein EA409_03415 [Saprospirales bacterium]|nr:MAG: hypothetical protein EA409_03415 [Saprospirales bacterium]
MMEYGYSQNTIVSPYSRLGMGELFGNSMTNVRGKGGLSSTDWSYRNLNLANPASYSYLRAASLNAGFNIQYNRFSDDVSGVNIWSGGMNTIAIGFPLINTINEMLDQTYSDWRFGTVVALQPFSGIGYEVESIDSDPEIGRMRRNFRGSGGTQLLMLGQSVKFMNTSIGFNGGYLFGSIEQERLVSFLDAGVHYINGFNDDIKVRGFYWKVGLMHDIILERSDSDPYHDGRGRPLRYITLGAHGKAATNFTNTANSLYIAQHEFVLDRDTLFSSSDLRSSGQLPPEFGFGASYVVKNKWELGFDIEMGLWSRYENEAKPEELKNSMRLAVGGSYTPNHESITSFFERVTYRGGIYYFKDPRVVGGDQLEEFGLNLGASFPFIVQRSVSSLHTSLQIGRRGISGGLQETFVNLSFGFTVNDNSWFLKRRFD